MGTWDVYCAICGSCISWTDLAQEELVEMSEDERNSARILSQLDTSWLNKYRCIGETSNSSNLDKVLITGPAEYDYYGGCDLHQPDEKASSSDDLPGNITTYSWGNRDNEPLAFPIHDICLFTLLNGAIPHIPYDSKAILSLDKELVFRALKEFGTNSTGNYEAYLDHLDYGENMDELHGQFWQIIPGTELYMANPEKIPALQEYYMQLPQLQQQSPEESTTRRKHSDAAANDIFSRLPIELLQHIMYYIPIDTIHVLRDVSPVMAAATNTNSFWRERVLQDMRWLYDFPNTKDMNLDWARIYRELSAKSDAKGNTESCILGLANRRRIWSLCEQIGEVYLSLKKNKDRTRKQWPLLEKAIGGNTLRLGQIENLKTETSTMALFDDIEDAGKQESTLQVHWNREGYLLGFSVETADCIRAVGCSSRYATRTDLVPIPQGDWLCGFIFTSREGLKYDYLGEETVGRVVVGVEIMFEHGNPVSLGENKGDKRIDQVGEGQLLVGFLAEATLHEGIMRLSLLRHEKHAGQRNNHGQVNPQPNKSVSSILWKDAIPPLHLTATEPLAGYWSSDFSVDAYAHSAVVFGKDEAELATLTMISIDAQFGGMELRYTDGSVKAFGPQRWAMKRFPIDGPGGERVTAVFMNVGKLPTGLRLLTNRNRQLAVGSNLTLQDHIKRSTATETICGMLCSWSNDVGNGKARMESIGVLSFSRLRSTDDIDDTYNNNIGPRDSAGLWWDPEAPSLSWHEDGTAYGQHEKAVRWSNNIPKPAESDIASWLDLTRRVNTVQVTVTHRDSFSIKNDMALSLVSIAMQYTDGSWASVGPDNYEGYSKASEEKNGFPWCWCHLDFSDKEELTQSPHYLHKQFTVGGDDYIAGVRLWTAPYLQGLQFVSARGVEGPIWGLSQGEPATISFGDASAASSTTTTTTTTTTAASTSEKGTVVGLKVTLADNERATTYSDRVVASVQALVR